MDPIDGTANFTRGLDHSCISVALAKDGYPVKGVIYNPYKQETYYAEKGMGAYLNGESNQYDNPIFSEDPGYPQKWLCGPGLVHYRLR